MESFQLKSTSLSTWWNANKIMIPMTMKIMMPIVVYSMCFLGLFLDHLQRTHHLSWQHVQCWTSLILKKCSLAPKSAFVNLPLIDPSLSLCSKTERILSSCHVERKSVAAGWILFGFPWFLPVCKFMVCQAFPCGQLTRWFTCHRCCSAVVSP